MIYLENLNLAYMAVPKAACTSIKAVLAVLDPDVDVSDAGALGRVSPHDIYPTKRFRPHRWETSEGAWRFTVLRDPVKRLLSVYTNRVVDLGELHNSPKLRAQSRLPLDPDPDTFFHNIMAYKDLSSVVKHHVLPMWLFTGKRPELFDRIYTTGELSQLTQDLGERTGQQIELPRANASSTKLSFDTLSEGSKDAIRAITRDDYALFGDLFPDPFA